MLTADFHFDLPSDLIAQTPLPERSDSRLLVCDASVNAFNDTHITEIVDFLDDRDLLVFNDTRVIPARLFAEKRDTGGKVEVLVERIVDRTRALCHVRASKSPKPGTLLKVNQAVEIKVNGRSDELFELRLPDGGDFSSVLQAYGEMPLPPYIERAADTEDLERYQTIYASKPGAVAAPTAGLHFDERLLRRLNAQGIESGFVTLHVGAGTFQPVRVDNTDNHVMHAERVEVGVDLCSKIAATRARGGRVVAVGTTVVRSLESAAWDGVVKPFSGETSIFIQPGYKFQCVDLLLTNFHLPESTLLMLVCAYGGHAFMLQSYRHAVEQRYRFFSYGDAMLVYPAAEARGGV